MASAPQQKPFINIPGIKSAKKVVMQVHGRGEAMRFRMFVGNKEVRLDPDNDQMDRSWFGLIVRELDRLKVWHYDTEEQDGQLTLTWTK